MQFTLAQIMLVLRLVQLTGPDDQRILINPELVVALRDPRGRPGEHFHISIKCLVFTSDSKYTAVIESCGEVRRKLETFEQEQDELIMKKEQPK